MGTPPHELNRRNVTMLEVMAALVTWSSPYRSFGAFSGSSGALGRDAFSVLLLLWLVVKILRDRD
jgi:hypothetical protein